MEAGCVTLLYGEAGAGKTNVCLQAAREVAESGKKVAYIDNEGLSYDRIDQVFVNNRDASKNLLIFQAHSLEEQTERIETIRRLAEAKVITMIVIDSLTMFYRLRHDEPAARSELVKQTEMLLDIARKYNMTIIVTSQVYANMNNGGVEFLGGHALGHNAKTILRLEKLENGRRKAVIMKHRSLPEGRSTFYRISETGIEDA